MREKLIDSALLIGLVVVCVVIVVTLFFPGSRRNAQTNNTPTTPVETGSVETAQREAEAGQTDVPLISSEGEAVTEETVAETEAQTGSELETDVEPDVETAVEAGAATETASEAGTEAETMPIDPEPTVAQPLPEGAFDLERIGFSFAGGTGACSVALEPWRHVAVSRDILAEYPCGTEVTIHLDEPVAGHDSFTAVVGDTMNPSNIRTVNIYVAPDEPALEYGVAAGRLEP